MALCYMWIYGCLLILMLNVVSKESTFMKKHDTCNKWMLQICVIFMMHVLLSWPKKWFGNTEVLMLMH